MEFSAGQSHRRLSRLAASSPVPRGPVPRGPGKRLGCRGMRPASRAVTPIISIRGQNDGARQLDALSSWPPHEAHTILVPFYR